MNDTNNLPEAVEVALAELLHAQLLLGVATAKRRPTADAPEVLAASKALIAVCDAVRAALAQPAAPDRWNEGFKHGQWLAKHSAPVVERADSATPVVERSAGNVSDNAATVAPAEPASEPAPAPRLRWVEAPRRTEWGAGMMEALIALGVDETLRLYAHRDDVPMVDALLPAQPAPALVPLTDEQAESLIENSDGRWHDGEFRIDGPDLMKLLRDAAQPAPARVPLTDQQLCSMRKENLADDDAPAWAYEKGVRDAENAHGITLAQGEPK